MERIIERINGAVERYESLNLGVADVGTVQVIIRDLLIADMELTALRYGLQLEWDAALIAAREVEDTITEAKAVANKEVPEFVKLDAYSKSVNNALWIMREQLGVIKVEMQKLGL